MHSLTVGPNCADSALMEDTRHFPIGERPRSEADFRGRRNLSCVFYGPDAQILR
jgi:hypothetical protein